MQSNKENKVSLLFIPTKKENLPYFKCNLTA